MIIIIIEKKKICSRRSTMELAIVSNCQSLSSSFPFQFLCCQQTKFLHHFNHRQEIGFNVSGVICCIRHASPLPVMHMIFAQLLEGFIYKKFVWGCDALLSVKFDGRCQSTDRNSIIRRNYCSVL